MDCFQHQLPASPLLPLAIPRQSSPYRVGVRAVSRPVTGLVGGSSPYYVPATLHDCPSTLRYPSQGASVLRTSVGTPRSIAPCRVGGRDVSCPGARLVGGRSPYDIPVTLHECPSTPRCRSEAQAFSALASVSDAQLPQFSWVGARSLALEPV